MASTPPLHPFPDSPEILKHVNVILPRPASPSANFPNPNTYRFPNSAAIYSLPKPTAPGTGCLTSLAPLLETVDCSPTHVPLPPTPPPKDTASIYASRVSRLKQATPPNPPPSRVPHIPPSRVLPPSVEARPSAPLFPIPSIAFHGPPTLPDESTLRPLHPRPLYAPGRPAPAPQRPSKGRVPAASRRHHHCCSWTAGIIIFLVGLILFAVGVTFGAMNAHNDSSLTGPGGAINLAAVLMGVAGFGSLTGSTTHLLWLFKSRKMGPRSSNRDSDLEEKDAREFEQLGGAGLRQGNSGGGLSGAARGSIVKGEDKEDIELLPLSTHRGHAFQKDYSSSSSRSSTPPDPRRTHAAFEDTEEQEKSKKSRRRRCGARNASKTSFLDLEEPTRELGLDRRLMEESKSRDRVPPHSRASTIGPSQLRGTGSSSNPSAPYNISKYNKRNQSLQRSKIEEAACVEEGDDEQMQHIVQYTASLDRLNKDKALRQQRYGAVSPTPTDQSRPISTLAARARADIAAALGPAIHLRDSVALGRSKGKEKAERSSITSKISDDAVVGDLLMPPSKARTPSSFSAANHPFPFATNSSTSLLLARQPVHLRSSSDSQIPRPTISLHPSNSAFHLKPPPHTLATLGPTGDLLQRINRAHKLAENRAAAVTPPESAVKDPKDLERSSGPLLPASVYTPAALSTSRPFGAERGTQPAQAAATATTPTSSTRESNLFITAPTHLAPDSVTPVSVAASAASASDSPLQSSELASDRETWARRKRSMDRRWSQEEVARKARVRPLFRSVESDEDRGG